MTIIEKIHPIIRGFVGDIVRSGLPPNDDSLESYQIKRMNLTIISLVLMVPFFGTFYLYLGVPQIAFGTFITGLLAVLCFFYFRKTKNVVFVANFILLIYAALIFYSALFLGGINSSSMWWNTHLPVLAVLMLDFRRAIFWIITVISEMFFFVFLALWDALPASPLFGEALLFHDSATKIVAMTLLFVFGVLYILERNKTIETLERTKTNLSTLYEATQDILSSLDMDSVLDKMIHRIRNFFHAEGVSTLLYQPESDELVFVAVSSPSADLLRGQRFPATDGIAGWALKERKLVVEDDVQRDSRFYNNIDDHTGLTTRSLIAIPMIHHESKIGVIEIINADSKTFDQLNLDTARGISNSAAIAIQNAQLFSNLEQSNIELRLAYDATIEGWSRAMDLRDKETEGHTQRVTKMTLKLARLMSMNDEQLVHVRRGALLHDMGKLGVPDHILLKPGKLTDEEWEIMRSHPQFAFEMLSPVEYLRPALEIPYCHHEKWDGTGYPRGLKGVRIPLEARIFAVVDVWDALLSDRPYRKAWSQERVLAHIRQDAGSHFDPQVVEAFIAIMTEGESAG